MKIDLLDKKIIYAFNWNCRETYSAIGKKLKTSKQVIRYRVEQLEKEGVIQSYHALIDWRKLGYDSVRVYLKWQNIEPEEEREIYSELEKNPLFMWTVKFEGEFDIAFYIWIKSIPAFYESWARWMSKYKQRILYYEMFQSVEMIHYPMKCLIGKTAYEESILGREPRAEYDAKDYEILKCLTEDACMPVIDIAKKLRLSAKAIIQRIRDLESKGILAGYNAKIDTDKLGYMFYKVDFYINDLSKLRDLRSYAKQHLNVVYVMTTVGGPDYEIEVMVESVYELRKIIQDIRSKFPGIIQRYREHRFEYTIKQAYLPGKNNHL